MLSYAFGFVSGSLLNGTHTALLPEPPNDIRNQVGIEQKDRDVIDDTLSNVYTSNHRSEAFHSLWANPD